MSQKRLKRIKKAVVTKATVKLEDNFLGIRGIIRENWKFLLILCVGVFLLYFNSLNGDFVSDDYATIPNNPNIDVFSYQIQTALAGLTNWVLNIFFGTGHSLPYHLFSLFLYLLTICFVYICLRLLGWKKLVSNLSTLVFAVLPIHVEVVSWISGRPYVFLSLLYLLTITFLILYIKGHSKKYLYLTVGLFLISFFSDKVRFFQMCLAIFLYLFSFGKLKKIKFNTWLTGLLLSFFVLGVIFLWPMVIDRVTSVNGGINASDSVFYNPFFQYPTAISKYLQLLVVPIDLTLYHTMYIFPVWLNWTILLMYLFGLIYFWLKNRVYFFALAMIFMVTLPLMMPIKVSWLVAERYIFFGSIGFCLVLGLIFRDLILFRRNRLVLSLFPLMILSYVARVYYRNLDWQTNHNLWVNTCQISPNSHNAWNNIGDDYDKLGQPENAIKGFSQSVLVKPNYADAYHNRANIFFKTGRLDLARESYQTALGFNPAMFQTYLSLTQIDLMEKNSGLALEHAQKVVQLQPNLAQSWYVAGVVAVRTGDLVVARELMKKSLMIDPNFAQAVGAIKEIDELERK